MDRVYFVLTWMLDEMSKSRKQAREAQAEHNAHHHADMLEDVNWCGIGAHRFYKASKPDWWQTIKVLATVRTH